MKRDSIIDVLTFLKLLWRNRSMWSDGATFSGNHGRAVACRLSSISPAAKFVAGDGKVQINNECSRGPLGVDLLQISSVQQRCARFTEALVVVRVLVLAVVAWLLIAWVWKGSRNA